MYTTCRWTGAQLLKPGLKLIGAKTKSRDLLYMLFPEHDIYIEPFAGSTTVLVGKAPSPIEIIGDTNEYLYAYITALQNFPKAFFELYLSELDYLHAGKKDSFSKLKDRVTKCETVIERAILFYLITKTSFNGIWRLSPLDGRCTSTYCQQTHARGWFTGAWFDAVVERYKGVQFINGPYEWTINTAKGFSGEKFLFLDPPYRYRKGNNGAGTVTTYNGQKFYDEDFIKLKEVLDSFNGKFLMTINDDQWTRDLFKDYNVIGHEISYSCSESGTKGRGAHPELLVANYPIQEKFDSLKSTLDARKEAKTKVRKRTSSKPSGSDSGVDTV